jgi:hypothetical protein
MLVQDVQKSGPFVLVRMNMLDSIEGNAKRDNAEHRDAAATRIRSPKPAVPQMKELFGSENLAHDDDISSISEAQKELLASVAISQLDAESKEKGFGQLGVSKYTIQS